MEAYLIQLTGIGEAEFRLVDKATYDYVMGPRPEFGSADSMQEVPPESMRQALWEAMEDRAADVLGCSRWQDVKIEVTENGWSNDRMAMAYGRYADQVAVFFKAKELIQFIISQNISLVDECFGVLD